MSRDLNQFPLDDNGEVLWQLAQKGDDFSIRRDVEFVLDFGNEDAALDCGMFLFKNEYKVQLSPPLEEEPASPWTVEVIPYMAPNYKDISELEVYLQKVAAHYGGKCTGWGCLADSTMKRDG